AVGKVDSQSSKIGRIDQRRAGIVELRYERVAPALGGDVQYPAVSRIYRQRPDRSLQSRRQPVPAPDFALEETFVGVRVDRHWRLRIDEQLLLGGGAISRRQTIVDRCPRLPSVRALDGSLKLKILIPAAPVITAALGAQNAGTP